MDDIAPPPSPRLDVRDLRVVLALASAGTTARAAAALHLTQPAVSRALLAAEERLGTRLFDRSPRGLVPTPAGQELVEGATRLLQVFGRERPRLRLERLPLTEAILDVARAGLGIAVLSEWITTPHLGRGDLVVKRLASGPLRRPWRMAWRKEVGDAALRLLAALESTAPRGLAVG